MNVTALDRFYFASDVTAHLSRNGYSFSGQRDKRFVNLWVYNPDGTLSRTFTLSSDESYISRRDYDNWCTHVGIPHLDNEREIPT